MKKFTPGHWNRGMEADGPLVPEGGGYPVVIPKTSLGAAFAEAFVARRRAEERNNMARRERAIAKGLRHETPAAVSDKRKYDR